MVRLQLLVVCAVFLQACIVQSKLKTPKANEASFDQKTKAGFVDLCSSTSATQEQKNTILLLKEIADYENCDQVFQVLNDLTAFNFKLPKVGSEKIIDLSLLNYFEHLKRLTISLHKISNIQQISALKGLERLVLNSMDLEDVAFLVPLTQLKFLDLSQNKIKSLEGIQNLKGLTDIWLSHNLISDIGPLKDLPKLRYLDLSENQVRDLSALKNAKDLRWLFLESNAIDDVSTLYELGSLTTVQWDVKRTKDVSESLLNKRKAL